MLAGAQQGVERGCLIILHVEEEQVAGRAGRCGLHPTEQIRLHEIHGAEQERAEAEGERDGTGLIGRAMQIRDALTQLERPRRPGTAASRGDEQRGGDPEHQHRAADGRADVEPLAHVPDARHHDADDAAHQQRIDRQARGVVPLSGQGRVVHLAANRLQRRHATQREQWPHGEHQRHPYAGGEAQDQRSRFEGEFDIDGEEVGYHAGEQELHGDAKHGAGDRAHEPHGSRLHHVQGQDLAAGRAEAAQHGHRVDLGRHEGVHAAGHTDAPQQQRDEADDAEEVGQAGHRLGEIPLGVRHRTHTHTGAGGTRQQPRRRIRRRRGRAPRRGGVGWRRLVVAPRSTALLAAGFLRFLQRGRLGVDPTAEVARHRLCGGRRGQRRGELEHHVVLGPAAELQQGGGVEPLIRHVHTGPDDRRDAGIAGHIAQRAGDQEQLLAEAERIADRGVEGDQERRIDEHDRLVVHARPGVRGNGFDFAVERIAG